MELRDALRMLRSEIGLTQMEFASAVNVGYTAESRWENKNTRPNRASSAAILALAKEQEVSAVCLDALCEILLASRADDKVDRELAAQVTDRMKVEGRILLTGDMMKKMLENLDLAVIGHRVFFSSPKEMTLIFSNRKYADIFGYSIEEFIKNSRKNLYFSVPDESRRAFEKLVERLLAGEIRINDFSQVLRGFRSNGDTIWLEIKGLSLERFSYGWDFFISCRDVTERIEAERKYAEEIAVRDASLCGFYASMHFDLTDSTVFRQRDIEKVTGEKFTGQSADRMLELLANGVFADNKTEFLEKFNRQYFIRAFAEKNTFDNVTCFNTVCGKWMRFDYVLIDNPYTHHLEALIYVYDAQTQIFASRFVDIVGKRNFDYIGVINSQSGVYTTLYYSPSAKKYVVNNEGNYQKVCEERLSLCSSKRLKARQRDAICLENVRRMLDQSEFFTTEFRLDEYDESAFSAKITYRYLDETKTNIIMAQHKRNVDVESILYKSSGDHK